MHAVGTALAWAVAEELIAAKACTIFATHFIELENLAHIYPSAFTSHMSSEDNEGEYVLTHQVRTLAAIHRMLGYAFVVKQPQLKNCLNW